MENRLIIANHKMNMLIEDLPKYLQKIENINNQNVIICPSNIYIPYFLKKGFHVGIQNIHTDSKNTCTGEISSLQAKKMGIKYAIIGHSERRIILQETDNIINKKIREALSNNLNVIMCIGETLEEKNMLKTARILKRQIINGLNQIEDINNIIIAYEPVWAIGTGVVPNNNEIISTFSYIKTIIDNLFPGNSAKIIYGGSITEKNIKELNKIKEINGFLIGGASLDGEKFMKIIEVVVGQ